MSTTATVFVAENTKAVQKFIDRIATSLLAGETSGLPQAAIDLPDEVSEILAEMSDRELIERLTRFIPDYIHGGSYVVCGGRSKTESHAQIYNLCDELGNPHDAMIFDPKAHQVRFCRYKRVAGDNR